MKQFLLCALALTVSARLTGAQEALATPASSATPTPEKTAETERVVVSAGAIEHSETETVEPVTTLSLSLIHI